MITYEEALKKAYTKRKNLDQVVEYANGYVFSSSDDAEYIGGLGHTPVVVLKKNGDIVDMMTFVNSGTGKEISRKSI